MSDEADVLTRGDAGARLEERSRGHVTMDAAMRKMSAAASLTGESPICGDRNAPRGLEFAHDTTTVRRLVERAVG